jgi:phosphatidylglycerophosphatase A
MEKKSTEVGIEVEEEQPSRSIFAWLIATFFGIGFLRPGSGTWASLATAALWWTGAGLLLQGSMQSLYATLIACGVLIAGIPASSIVARESGVHDPGHVVIDEVAGQLIALIAVPLRWQYVLASFILFRGFDIVKQPPPIRQLEKLPGGSGIMLDDVGAGIYANVIMQVLIHFRVLH